MSPPSSSDAGARRSVVAAGRAVAAALALVVAVFLAYVFGAGYVSARGVGAPAPWNVAGAALIAFAGIHAAKVLAVGRRRPAGLGAVAATAGAALTVATAAAVVLPRL